MRFVGGRAAGAGQGQDRPGDEQGAPVGADDLGEFGGGGGDDTDIPF